MITIQESNVYAYITCETTEEELAVKKCLTFVKEVKKYSRRPFKMTTRFYRKQGKFLLIFKGIVSDLIAKLALLDLAFACEKHTVQFPQPRKKNYEEAIVDLRPYQIDAFNAAVSSNGGILWLATNAGKTEVAGAIIKAYPDRKFLYLVSRLELLTQTIERFRDKLGIDVGELSTSEQNLKRHVTVAMTQTLYSRMEKLAPYLSTVECVIWDECQHAGGKTAEVILGKCTGAIFRLGLTGTVPPNEPDRLSIQQFFGPVSYRVPNEYLIDHEYSSGIQIYMVRGSWSDTGVGPEVQRLVMLDNMGMRLNLWHEACMMGIVKNEARNAAIHKVLTSILRTGGSGVLIFVDYIEHGNILSELTGVPFVSSESQDRNELFSQFKSGKIDCLITSPILDEGVDVSRIHHIIFSSGRKSKIKLLQRIGRGLRKEEGKTVMNLYDFYDDETPMFTRHTKKRLEIYESEGFPVEIKNIQEF